MISTLVALALAAQCRGGACPPAAGYGYGYTTAYVAQSYQLADSKGQLYQHADPAWLSTWMVGHNAVLAAQVVPQAPQATPQAPQIPINPTIDPTERLVPQAPVVQPPVVLAPASDPYGFGASLNAARLARGLRPLAYSPGLSASAAANSSRGFGHHLGGYGRGQCSGVGSPQSVLGMWLSDPPHARILLDHGATTYGIGGAGSVWTCNIN